MRTASIHALAVMAALVVALSFPQVGPAHLSGCHSAHSCPSDHHSYVWYDASGAAWDCAEPGASEYNPATDTTVISYGGYSYYCQTSGQTPNPQPVAPAPSSPPPTPTAQSPAGPTCRLGRLPDRRCTPGATFHVTVQQVCARGYSRRVRKVSAATRGQVFARYGVKTHRPGQYEVDHLIALELGGSNAISNLFPEAGTPRPGFREKDKLENRLHSLVCGGKLSLSKAQRLIKRDWVGAYHRYVR